jgi:hypothetical protein
VPARLEMRPFTLACAPLSLVHPLPWCLRPSCLASLLACYSAPSPIVHPSSSSAPLPLTSAPTLQDGAPFALVRPLFKPCNPSSFLAPFASHKCKPSSFSCTLSSQECALLPPQAFSLLLSFTQLSQVNNECLLCPFFLL